MTNKASLLLLQTGCKIEFNTNVPVRNEQDGDSFTMDTVSAELCVPERKPWLWYYSSFN